VGSHDPGAHLRAVELSDGLGRRGLIPKVMVHSEAVERRFGLRHSRSCRVRQLLKTGGADEIEGNPMTGEPSLWSHNSL
jgi:hypothetical protein